MPTHLIIIITISLASYFSEPAAVVAVPPPDPGPAVDFQRSDPSWETFLWQSRSWPSLCPRPCCSRCNLNWIVFKDKCKLLDLARYPGIQCMVQNRWKNDILRKKKKIREENRERREENEEMSAKKDQEIRLFRGNTFSQKSAPPTLSLLLKKKIIPRGGR